MCKLEAYIIFSIIPNDVMLVITFEPVSSMFTKTRHKGKELYSINKHYLA